MDRLGLVIKTRAQEGKREEIAALYRQMMAPRALENDEQQVVVWCGDMHDPDVFYLFEIYASQEAFGANASAPWFAEYMGAVGPLLAGEPEVAMATVDWSKGV